MKAFRLIVLLLVLIPGTSRATIMYAFNSSDFRIKIPREMQADTAKINSLTRTGFKYLSSKGAMLKEAQACIDSALAICSKKNIEVPALLHLLSAQYHFATGDYSTASEEASLAMKRSASTDESLVQVKTLIFLGRYYHQTGFFKESIENYEKGIAVAKKTGLKGIIPMAYFGQAMVYETVADLKGIRENLKLMIDAGFAENDSSSAEMGLYRLGSTFLGDSVTSSRRDFKQADSILKKSLKISFLIKDSSFIASSMAQIGWNFYLRNMFDSSIFYYKKSLDYRMIANSLGNLGTIYRDLEKPKEAIKYYQMAIDQAKKINDWYNLQWIYFDMSNMYLSLKDTSNAYTSYVLYKKFSDIWKESEARRGLADARIRYEADRHNKEVELLSLRIKNQRLLNYGFIGFIMLVVAVGFLLWRGSQLKAKRRISEMNHQISEIQQANLRQQMNPHFIFNTLNSIQYYMYQHDKLATNNYLTKFSNLMRKVLENSRHTSIPLSDELNALTLYLELESIRFKDKFDYEINVDDEIDTLLYKVPTMLIQPYVENSICHGLMPMESKGKVKVDIKLNNSYLLCSIEDNGIGRDAARERNTAKENNHNSLGTRIAASRLDLVNALYGSSLKTSYTDLKDTDGKPAGTLVEMQIPVMT